MSALVSVGKPAPRHDRRHACQVTVMLAHRGKWPTGWRKLLLIADPGDDSPMSRTIEVPEYRLHEEVHLDPARTALVVVDMQNDFVREGGSLRVPDAEATIPAISRLLGLARARGMRVVYSQDTHRDGDPEWRICPQPGGEGGGGG